MAFANATTIFIIVPVEDVVATIFDAPVAPVGAQDLLGVGLLGGPTGETVGDFIGQGLLEWNGLFPSRVPGETD